MAKRKAVSATLRWSVFARDNYACRYCGAQAGQEGVILHADHLVSVADGGESTFDNLITACSKCNGGKGARSFQALPDAADVADRMADRAKSIKKQALAIKEAIKQESVLAEQAARVKQEAYWDGCKFRPGEKSYILSMCKEFGTETVLGWYRYANSKNISDWEALLYVCGIARNVRKRAQENDDAE